MLLNSDETPSPLPRAPSAFEPHAYTLVITPFSPTPTMRTFSQPDIVITLPGMSILTGV